MFSRVRKRAAGGTTGALAAALAATVLMPLTAQEAHAAPSHYWGNCPTVGVITQGYHSDHDGVDIGNDLGTPIYAAGPGTVIASGPARGYGQWIRIRHTDGTVTEYGHMYRRFVVVGESVSSGELIALMGEEGNSTGPHLHFEAHQSESSTRGVDPGPYLAVRGVTLPCRSSR